jgi:hypothetical protein
MIKIKIGDIIEYTLLLSGPIYTYRYICVAILAG